MKRKIKEYGIDMHVVVPPAPLVVEQLPSLMDKLERAQSYDERLEITKDACCRLCFTRDYQDGKIAFVTHRMPRWQGE